MNYFSLHPLLVEVEWPGPRITLLTTNHRQTLDNKNAVVTRNVFLFAGLQTFPVLLVGKNKLFFPIVNSCFFQNLHSFSFFIIISFQ